MADPLAPELPGTPCGGALDARGRSCRLSRYGTGAGLWFRGVTLFGSRSLGRFTPVLVAGPDPWPEPADVLPAGVRCCGENLCGSRSGGLSLRCVGCGEDACPKPGDGEPAAGDWCGADDCCAAEFAGPGRLGTVFCLACTSAARPGESFGEDAPWLTAAASAVAGATSDTTTAPASAATPVFNRPVTCQLAIVCQPSRI